MAKAQKNKNRIRIVTYLPQELVDKITEESKKMGLDESVFLRQFLTLELLKPKS